MVQHADIDHTGLPGVGGIAASLLDAKGDLIAASAADTPARLAVGTNGYILAADSSTSTGLRWLEKRYCRKTADEGFSSTSYANSTSMSLAISASKVYAFRFVIFYTTNATSVGIKLAIQGPASCLAYAGMSGFFSAGSISADSSIVGGVQASGDISTDLALLTPATGPGGTATMAVVEGILVNSTNAGNLVLRHASETATTTTILQNSYGELTELI
jgi:hypothetical protein